MRFLWSVVTILLLGFSSAGFACQEKISFSDVEVIELLEKVKSLKKNNVRIALEFNRLLCAQRRIVRDSARQVGMQSSVSAIRSMALQSALFEKDVINFTVLPKEDMTDREREFLKKHPVISYPVTFVNDNKACIGLKYDDKCYSDYLVSVSGSEVDLRYRKVPQVQRAKLRLTEEGKLRGIWSNGGSNEEAISVRVEIRLD